MKRCSKCGAIMNAPRFHKCLTKKKSSTMSISNSRHNSDTDFEIDNEDDNEDDDNDSD